jgi:hypothetical protein
MEKGGLVIFCGAGFSADFGIPVMGTFVDRLRDSGFLSPTDQAEFDDIQLACDSLGLLIGNSSRNLEQLSSILAVLDITRPNFTFPGCKSHNTPADALGLVKRCIHRLVRPDLGSNDLGQLPETLRKIREQYNISFVTSNYDLVLELAGHGQGAASPVRPTPSVLRACSPPNRRTTLRHEFHVIWNLQIARFDELVP